MEESGRGFNTVDYQPKTLGYLGVTRFVFYVELDWLSVCILNFWKL